MRWMGERESSNIEDRRGISGGGIAAGGGLLGLIVLVVSLLTGHDPGSLQPSNGSGSGGAPGVHRPLDPAREEQEKKFVAVVLGYTEDVWDQLFRQQGKRYPKPVLTLFTDTSQSGCGFASAATGPFYCPTDQHVYIDLQFFDELATRFRAAGDFAQAYVIAHEIGHHVQKTLGILDRVHAQERQVSKAEANQLSVRTELQADFLAGVWAHHAQQMKNILEPGDLEEALRAASAVGDDRLQQQSRGYVVPDSFTHGTSEQRARWFRLGFETGDLSQMMELFKRSYDSL
ncbi:MAG TPA: neutral zinc metallopeptidase [Blastocatellia bacterium]|nr:neutral zinc metallopeptidase [Blastocatellia bacterium]